MKRIVLLLMFVCAASALEAQNTWAFKGTVIRMKMADCAVPQHSLMMAMSGGQVPMGMTCPEYTVMSERVVYRVMGRKVEDFIPLAENMDFLIRKNELVLFSDDEKTKTRFVILQMTLRADWEREEQRRELEQKMMERSADYELRNSPRAAMLPTTAR